MQIDRINVLTDPVTIKPAVEEAFFYGDSRPGQLETVQHFLNNMRNYDDFIIEEPVGSGKSAILEAIMEVLKRINLSSYYAVNRKGLQVQNVTDFGENRLTNMWGRSNYRCLCSGSHPTIANKCRKKKCYHNCNAATAPCVTTHRFKCEAKGLCPYYMAKEKAVSSSKVLCNFQYLSLEHSMVGEFGQRFLFIMDEAHDLENELMRLHETNITENMLSRLWGDEDVLEYAKGKILGTLLCKQKTGQTLRFTEVDWHEGAIDDTYDFNETKNVFNSGILPRIDSPTYYIVILYECSVLAYKKWSIGMARMKLLMRRLKDRQDTGGDTSAIDDEIKDLDDDLQFYAYIIKMNHLSYMLATQPKNWVVYIKGKCSEHNRVEIKELEKDDGYCPEWTKGHKCGRELKDFQLVFKTVKIDWFAIPFLSGLGTKRIYCSATIPPENHCKSLGIEKCLYIGNPDSQFPVENRLIYYQPVGRMSYKKRDKTLPKMAETLTSAVQGFQNIDLHDKRILILPFTRRIGLSLYDNIKADREMPTQQYRRLKDTMEDWFLDNYKSFDLQVLKNYLKQIRTSRLLYHSEKEIERNTAIKMYSEVDDAVLLTTYLNQGFDGKNDLCRAIFIPKIPFADLGDKQVKARFDIGEDKDKEGQKWYSNNTKILLEQMSGRGVRNIEDWCVMAILDESFMRLWNTVEFNKTFKEAVRFVDGAYK